MRLLTLAAIAMALCVPATASDTRPLLRGIDSWIQCQPCRAVEAELHRAGVEVRVTTVTKQMAPEYPTAYYVTAGGARFEERGSATINKRIRSGNVRYTGTGARPVVEVRMWKP